MDTRFYESPPGQEIVFSTNRRKICLESRLVLSAAGIPADAVHQNGRMTAAPETVAVELWAASIPGLGRIADHHWFVVYRATRIDRWEVWQSANFGGESWGHLHRNLKPPRAGVGNGPGRMLRRWIGEEASALAGRIERSPGAYPWCSRYFAWPGPNSNTFVQWVLQNRHTLSWRGIGRGYGRRAAAGLQRAATTPEPSRRSVE